LSICININSYQYISKYMIISYYNTKNYVLNTRLYYRNPSDRC